MSSEQLNVIALISGGKDSFFNLLHCVHHGHRIVALANLLPVTEHNSTISGVQYIDPAEFVGSALDRQDRSHEKDLNSFMYQTVGHEIIPLYAAATGLPLYRMPIRGGAVHHERDYDYEAQQNSGEDETESMIPLLEAVKARHPEANAICSGAILSTYQRTRVESIALRLGLTPLAYLWKYPVLPPPLNGKSDEAQLLRDMAGAGLEARIIKVASAGLDESHLWERVSSEVGVHRIKSALRKFGAAEGATLGEGGEFETLVLDGPSQLFRKCIVVPGEGRTAVHEGGGSTWLMLQGAQIRDKVPDAEKSLSIREPTLLDATFQSIWDSLCEKGRPEKLGLNQGQLKSSLLNTAKVGKAEIAFETHQWSFLSKRDKSHSIEEETNSIVDDIRETLSSASADAAQITNTIVIIRNMADFPKLNAEYGKLFPKPNPPSRITISCGDLLPEGHNIAVYLTLPKLAGKSQRNGLHVQSRSYWAPANIGPYSQAIDVPVTLNQETTGLKETFIAGQIPLIPASMLLPPPPDTSLHLQIALSLQHLWRIGQEMKVQVWTSAVAYFARCESAAQMASNAQLAGLAWRRAHEPQEEDDDDDNDGPDAWDLKYNSQHISLASTEKAKLSLPDWSVFSMRQQNEPQTCVPPMFSVEIEELPRQSTIEWHAHTGLSGIDDGSLELVHLFEIGVVGWKAWHAVVRGAGAYAVYTVLAQRLDRSEQTAINEMKKDLLESYQASLKHLGLAESLLLTSNLPYLVYFDTVNRGLHWLENGGGETEFAGVTQLPVIPCQSIRNMNGEELGCVALYKSLFQSS